jgi:tight adherence protein C
MTAAAAGDKPPSQFQEELNKPFAERVLMPVVRKVSDMVSKKTSGDYVTVLRTQLAQAGYPGGLRPQEFIAVQILVAVIFAAMGGLVGFVILNKNLVFNLIVLLGGLMLGVLVPRYYLQSRITHRRHLIQLQLADILDLLTVAVEAGLGFDAGLAKCVEKMAGPLPEEFDGILREIRMGKGRKESLKDAAARIGVHDVDVFFSAIIQAEQLGVSLGRVLRVQSDQLRVKRKQRAEEEAMKAPIKMMLPLVGCVFPTIMIVLLGPAVIRAMIIFKK